MPSPGAYPYQAVARTRGGIRAPLPIDSPTLLTRRRYSESSVVGFGKGGTLAEAPTGAIYPHPWPGEGAQWPGFPNHPRSDVGLFAGGIVGDEGNPDVVRMPIGIGLNKLVTIAHRSMNIPMSRALNAGLWAAQSPQQSAAPPVQPGRRYALPYTFGFNQSDQQWPTSAQWLAGQMPGTS